MRKQKGITLVALVVTIIVLLILAGVSISMISGDDGIATQAAEAKSKTEAATQEELEKLGTVDDYIQEKVNASASGTADGDNAITLSGVWTFNEVLNYPSEIVYAFLDFNYDGVDYNQGQLRCNSNNLYIRLYYGEGEDDWTNGPDIYFENSWGSSARTIDFGSTPQEVSQEFYDWFITNATRN